MTANTMNIAVDIRCLMNVNRTGVGEYTYQLLNAIFATDKINQYFLFYNSTKDILAAVPKWEQVNVHYIGLRWPNKLLNFLLWLGAVKLDRVVCSAGKVKSGALDYWFSPNLNFTSLGEKTKFILTIHDLSFKFLPECFTWRQQLWHWALRPRKQCQRADIVLAPSKNTANDVVSEYGIDGANVRIVKHGQVISNKQLVISDTRQRHNLPEKYILYVGTIEPRKNLEAVITAFQKLHRSSPVTYHLVIVGSQGWKNERVMKLIKQNADIHYLGYVSDEEKQALYQFASLFVFPSLYEGFGLPVLEAMANGVPVIASNRPSLPEVAGEAVYYINPCNIDELARAMKLVLTDEELRRRMVQKGLEQAKGFSWESAAKEFVNLVA